MTGYHSKYDPGWADAVAFSERAIDDEIADVGDPTTAAVYVIRSLQPATKKKLKQNWQEWIASEVPSYAWAAYHAESVYYVGGTGNLQQRLRDHVSPEGAEFLMVFPFWRVHEVVTCPNRESAMLTESDVADRLREEVGDDCFVYQA